MKRVPGHYNPDTGKAYVDLKGGKIKAEILYDEIQVAEMFGVTIYTVRYWRRERIIDHMVVNRTVRFSEAQIQDFIERNSIPAQRDMTPTKAAV